MILTFTFGFAYKGFTFGWLNKELYRLPSESKNKHYTLKKLKPIKIGNKVGYRIKRDKFTMEQLEEKTMVISVEVKKIIDENVPFQNI